MAETNRCGTSEQDLLLYLYDEMTPAGRAAVEGHLAGCDRCRAAADSLRATMIAIDRARIPQSRMAAGTPDWDAVWRSLRRRLEAPRVATGWPRLAMPLLKAAGVVLVAGASFGAGRQWEAVSGFLGLGQGSAPLVAADAPAPPPGSDRLEFFTQRTHGYLNRSRIVLLAFANTRDADDAKALRQASLKLLRETKSARQVAGKLADPRIDDLLAQLETILGEISRLSDQADTAAANRIRAEVASSGVLDQLELLSNGAARLAQERS